MKTWPTKTIHRSELKLAKYNPRTIDDASLEGLKRSMKRFGVVQDIIWNERTGVVVGGHQRLKILDAEHKGTDYHVDVKVVDLSERDEKALNVALNNPNITGRYDGDALLSLLHEHQDDIKAFVADTGFTAISLASEFEMLGASTEILDDLFTAKGKRQQAEDIAAIAGIFEATETPKLHKDTPEGIRERKAEVEERNEDSKENDYYVTLVFKHDENKRRFLAAVGERDVTAATIDGHKLAVNLKIDVGD